MRQRGRAQAVRMKPESSSRRELIFSDAFDLESLELRPLEEVPVTKPKPAPVQAARKWYHDEHQWFTDLRHFGTVFSWAPFFLKGDELESLISDMELSSMSSPSLLAFRQIHAKLKQGMTEQEFQSLLEEGSAAAQKARVELVPAAFDHVGQPGNRPAAAEDAGKERSVPRRSSALENTLAALAVFLMRHKATASLLARIMSSPRVNKVIRPLFTTNFVAEVFRRPNSAEAIRNFLRRSSAAKCASELLCHKEALTGLCQEPDTPASISAILGGKGLGKFFYDFLGKADPKMLAALILHPNTAELMADVMRETSPVKVAELVHKKPEDLAHALNTVCQEPGLAKWVADFLNRPGMDAWIGALLTDPRGACFARRMLLCPGFMDFVDAFVVQDGAKVFVSGLLKTPGVCGFVTWLNLDPAMHRWFAQLVSREDIMHFVSELIPEVDRNIVGLLQRQGNDTALASMLNVWVRSDRVLGRVVSSFAKKPAAPEALASVIMSPGFFDGVVVRRLLAHPGFNGVAVDALSSLGVRGLYDHVVPLMMSTASAVMSRGLGVFLMDTLPKGLALGCLAMFLHGVPA